MPGSAGELWVKIGPKCAETYTALGAFVLYRTYHYGGSDIDCCVELVIDNYRWTVLRVVQEDEVDGRLRSFYIEELLED